MKMIKVLYLASLMLISTQIYAELSDKNVANNYALKANAAKDFGLVVYSITENCPSSLILKIRGISNKDKLDLKLKQGTLDWLRPCGRLLILKFKQGEYEIYSYEAFELPKKSKVSRDFAPVANVSENITLKDKYKRSGLVFPKQDLKKRFKVFAGKVTYAGSLHFRRDTIKKQTYISGVDNKDRDLKLLLKRMPQIKMKDIIH